jgi:uncharacterized protein (TIGR00369 family)
MDLDALRQVMEDLVAFNKFLGVRAIQIDSGQVRLEVPFRPELVGDPIRPALHGGVISALADAAGGGAVWSRLEDPRARVSTIDLRIDYLRPARLETLVAEANVVRVGRRVGVVDVRLFHPSAPHETIATGKGVYNISVPKGAASFIDRARE